MAISPHVALLRALVGKELLQLPGVSIVPVDATGRFLLVRHAGSGTWGILGGTIEIDENPEQAAIRETSEEIGLRPTLTRLLGAFGGPEYRVEYPNGDLASYVLTAYEAAIEGEPTPDGDEVTDARWFTPASLGEVEVNRLARALLRDAGYLPSSRGPGDDVRERT